MPENIFSNTSHVLTTHLASTHNHPNTSGLIVRRIPQEPIKDQGPIVGHTNTSNRLAAEMFKQLLQDDPLSPAIKDDSLTSEPVNPEPESLYDWYDIVLRRPADPNVKATLDISVDPDLHPLAVEHPARVWNFLLHSTPRKYQPTIRWKYDISHSHELEITGGQEDSFLAHLTLTLPPEHPFFDRNPHKKALMETFGTEEYEVVAEQAKGVVRCTGEWRSLKALAQNVAITKLIIHGALDWIFGEILNVQVRIKAEEDEADTSVHESHSEFAIF
ncbi:hypothetical protein TREMEDRAFT_60066 [Tremella mesenterica DSM 1558]|uniref:uncharacterized protein n=1 Tax=Tremella mesenterica (strain ATCC 24925 / CBS 8224 / DSM 1558 / NBRC 9311 / NRRL Y-6157 / RJB 2259-6 / UBC 559-6) TaxID=578456 RepID=UPI0003F49A36|nr:uncharacterized protein TREMEDRAFT_60066 [Tremella mesenterica DSM 1558]EIW71130.1 hypothetical protein TREMEDRAFT_60066 [Tremella mesenterica DSM 1558]